MTLLPPGKGRGVVWGDSGHSVRCCRPPPPHPSLLPCSSTWEIYFCCIASDAQAIPGNHGCHQTCHSHQLCAASTGPRVRAALGCCLRGVRQQKGAGRGLHRRGLPHPKCFPCSGWAGGEEGRVCTGGGSPSASPPAMGPHSQAFQDATEPRAPLEKGCHRDAHSSATWASIGLPLGVLSAFGGHSPSGCRQDVLARGGRGVCCFPPAEDMSPFVSVG